VVAHSGAAGSPGRDRPLGLAQARPLNRPRPLRAEAGESGRPVAVWLDRRLAVEEVLAVWRIDDEWWRPRPVSRLYYSLLLEDGRTLVAFRDLVSGRWWAQRY
jgi:hypothetical protein